MPDVELSEIKSLEPNNQDRQQDESDLEPIFPIESPNESIKEQASNNHLNIISSNVSHEDNQVGSASHQSERAVNNEIEVSPQGKFSEQSHMPQRRLIIKTKRKRSMSRQNPKRQPHKIAEVTAVEQVKGNKVMKNFFTAKTTNFDDKPMQQYPTSIPVSSQNARSVYGGNSTKALFESQFGLKISVNSRLGSDFLSLTKERKKKHRSPKPKKSKFKPQNRFDSAFTRNPQIVDPFATLTQRANPEIELVGQPGSIKSMGNKDFRKTMTNFTKQNKKRNKKSSKYIRQVNRSPSKSNPKLYRLSGEAMNLIQNLVSGSNTSRMKTT